MNSLQYPIGRFEWPATDSAQARASWIDIVAATPYELRAAVSGLDDEQLDTVYRDGGWTLRQVVHHYADDHMNSYVRFKLALTEESPVIKGYSESAWAELPDARFGPIDSSLDLLEALHQRWVSGWKHLSPSDWDRVFLHPVRGPLPLTRLAALYAWHGRHHVAQITGLRTRKGW